MYPPDSGEGRRVAVVAIFRVDEQLGPVAFRSAEKLARIRTIGPLCGS